MSDLAPEFDALIGTPFAWDGRGPHAYDCYGLVRELLKREGRNIPDYKYPGDGRRLMALFALELRLWERCEPRKGAVVLIHIPTWGPHCGYMIDDVRMIHTWEQSGGVAIEPIELWQRHVRGFYNYVG
jgi:cell wall-associated NlpC family hydrolase